MPATITRRKLRRRDTAHTDLAGFVERLIELGFRRQQHWTKPYRIKHSPYEFLRTYWTLRGPHGQYVRFKITRHRYALVIKQHGKRQLQISSVCWSRLELPFLKYFRQEQPLCLRRLAINTQPKKLRAALKNQPQRIVLPNPQLTSRPRPRAALK